MKITTTLLLLFSFTLPVLSQNDNCKLIINGKEFASKSAITKEDLMKFCSLEQKDTRVERNLKPVYLEWVFSFQGKIIKGTLHDCSKLEDAVKTVNGEAILFIDKIKYKDVAGLCQGQFALTIK